MRLQRGLVRLARWGLRHRPRTPSSGRPRVVFVLAHAYGVGGTTRTCLTLAEQLAHDHEVTVLSVLRRRRHALLPEPAGVTVLAADDGTATAQEGRLRRLLRFLPSVLLLPADQNLARRVSLYTDLTLIRTLWRAGDAIFIGTRPALNDLVLVLRRPGSTVVTQEHMNFAAHRPAMRSELLRIHGAADAAVMLTEGDRDAFAAALGRSENLHAIPNGVPRHAGPPAALEEKAIVAVGRLTHQKGFDLLIEAFALVSARRPEWELRICGAGRLRGQLEEQIDQLGLTDRISLRGQVRDISAELRHASIYTLSSRFEGLPMALLEAMAVGLPVVAFDCPTGPAEILEHGRSGILVPEGDVAALAGELLALIDDEPRRRELAARALRRSADYAIDVTGRRWAELLDGLARRLPSPDGR